MLIIDKQVGTHMYLSSVIAQKKKMYVLPKGSLQDWINHNYQALKCQFYLRSQLNTSGG